MDPNDAHILTLADVGRVAAAASRVRTQLSSVPFPYSPSAYATLSADPGSVADAAVEELVAAAVLPHCIDGWGYLGRSLSCMIGGDFGAAVHLGYYAELRAAMCLLASQSIGVLNLRHVVLTQPGQLLFVPPQPKRRIGTHTFVWEALDKWIDSQAATDLLDRIFQPGGLPLSNWLDALSPGLSNRQLARQWFRQWGIDLHRMKDDRESRNAASYHPSTLDRPVSSTSATIESVQAVWRLFEPAAHAFDFIDRFILRRGLELGFEIATANRPTDDIAGFRRAVTQAVEALRPAYPPVPDWKSFLLSVPPVANIAVLEAAEKNDPPSSPAHPFQVLSRAAILLRLATGSAHDFMRRASWPSTDVAGWAEALGIDLGLWESGDRPQAMADLWLDVDDALEAVMAATSGTAPVSRFAIQQRHSTDLATLGSCERIGLWGLNL